MADRTLFLPASPVEAYLVVRDRSIRTEADSADLVLLARRNACPGGIAVGVRVAERQVRELDDRGRYLVDRRAAEQGITRAYQPWHVDVETDPAARWRGYLDDTYNLTLRNLLNAQTPGTLREQEDDRVEARLIRLVERPVDQTFDLDHLRTLHRWLFQDVYPWAGETRTVDMHRRGGPSFAPWAEIQSRWDALADRIEDQERLRGMGRDEFPPAAASVYNEVNTVHAFREGNGRTQRAFMDDLARGAGWQLDWTKVRGPFNDLACQLAREGDDRELWALFDQITSPAQPASVEYGDAVWSAEQRAALDLASPLGYTPGAGPLTPPAPARAPRPAGPAHGPKAGYRRGGG